MMRFALAVLLGLALIPPLRADFTGNTLNLLCTDGSKQAETSCSMWIAGFSAGIFAAQGLAHSKGTVAVTCIPNGVTGIQVRAIVEKYMREHPSILHVGADAIASFAIERAFLCRNSN